MSATNLAILILYALGMSIGQLLFKLSADHASAGTGHGFWINLLGSLYFYASVLLYALLTVAWIWILTRIPLSQAYPFVVLAFVFTPSLAALIFGEALDARYFAGLALILCGLGVLFTRTA